MRSLGRGGLCCLPARFIVFGPAWRTGKMLLRTKKYDLEKPNRPRELTRSVTPGWKDKTRMSLTMRKHKQRMQKKRQEQDRLLRERPSFEPIQKE